MSTICQNDILKKWQAALDASPEMAGSWGLKKSGPDSPVSRVKHACEGVATSIFSFQNRFAAGDGLSTMTSLFPFLPVDTSFLFFFCFFFCDTIFSARPFFIALLQSVDFFLFF